MSKFYVTVAAAVAVGASALLAIASEAGSGASPQTLTLSEKLQQIRHASPRKAAPAQVRRALAKVMAGGKQLYGYCFNSDFSESLSEWNGFSTISASGEHQALSGEAFIGQELLSGCYFNGKIFGVTTASDGLIYAVYDAETWDQEAANKYLYPADYLLPMDLTFDPTTQRVYGCFVPNAKSYQEDTGAKLSYINFSNAFEPTVEVGDMDVVMRGMASDVSGQLWGIGRDNVLYKIDKATAALTKVSDITWPSNWNDNDMNTSMFYGDESAEIDWETGDIYFSLFCAENPDYEEGGGGDTYIMKIDPKTGDVEMVADFGYWALDFGNSDTSTGTCEVFSVIYFKQQAAVAAGTPQVATNLTVDPVGYERKANVSFDLPSLDTDGNELSGNLTWTVATGATELATGTAAAGSHVTTAVSVADDAMYDIQVAVSAGSSTGAPVSTRSYIGCDTPGLINLPNAFADGCDVSVSWRQAIGMNGGNLAPVTYRVVRQPDNVVVAEAVSDLFVEDHIADTYKKRYTYEVTPVSGAKRGEAIASRPLYAGITFDYPHVDSFNDAVLFNQYPAIDNNNDGCTWWVDVDRGAAVYSGNNTQADDYMLIGPFDMVAGSVYTFNMLAGGHSGPERIAVYAGTSTADASTYTTTVIDVEQLNPSLTGDRSLTGTFTPSTSGRYYFGVKACSPGSLGNLYVYDVKVTGVSPLMPAAPVLEVTPLANGARLDFTLPTRTLDGSKAADVRSVNIYRDNELLTEISAGVADGATLSYTDTKAASKGTHTYNVVAVNSVGEGQPAVVEAYLGLDFPGAPRNMRVYEDLNTMGLIHVTWEAPTRGANGGYIDPSTVTYNVDWLSYGAAGVGEKNVGGALSFDLVIPQESITEQDIIAFSVKASNQGGNAGNLSSETRSCYFGPSYGLPLQESWSDGRAKSGIWSGESVKETDEELFESIWTQGTGGETGYWAQDADGYMSYLSTDADDGAYRLRSPRVTIASTTRPVLVFHLYMTEALKEFHVDAAVDDKPMTTIRTFTPADGANKWMRVEVDLTPYKDCKYIQFGFSGFVKQKGTGAVAIDNLTISDYVDRDMAITSVTGPKKVAVNDDVTIGVTVRNAGAADIAGADYKVNLYKNGRLIATEDGIDLKAYVESYFEFIDSPLPTDPATTVYYAEIDFDSDQVADNNRSEDVAVELTHCPHPGVTDLAGKPGNGVTLTWSRPSLDGRPNEAVTDGFDSYPSFVYDSFGNWSTIDGDGRPTVIIATGLGPVQYPNVGQPMAWMVFNPEETTIIHSAWNPRSGNNMLVSFQACFDNARDVESDDWLISPELDGSAQTISFYARAGMKDWAPEFVEIYTSTTGTAREDFELLESEVQVPYASDWVEFKFDLPEGTRHFAIVHRSFNKFTLLVDDITYIPAGAVPADIKLVGYHIYRDGERLTTEPVTSTRYLDFSAEDGKEYTYHVTAVWDKGESVVSNPVTVSASSAIYEVDAAEAMTVVANGLTVTVGGVEGQRVELYTTSGVLVGSVQAAPEAVFTLPSAGIYIVRAAGRSVKVAVR